MYLYSFLTAMLGVPALGFPFAWTFGSNFTLESDLFLKGRYRNKTKFHNGNQP
jgi:hypothetical protein